MNRPTLLALGLIGALALSACGDSGSDVSPTDGATDEVTLKVAAAASLTDTFTQIAKDFEAEHPGTTVELTFAGSSDLVTQIQGGAPIDVFASADEANMDKVADEVAEPTPFATNVLTIVTEPGNPKQVTGLADLATDDLDVVVCAPQVPCGAATAKVTELAGVTLTPRSEESKVTDVLAKVREGEADAGLVYVTDATGAGDAVSAVDFPETDKVVNTYPIAALKGSRHADLAAAFTDYVAKGDGRGVLEDAGFGAP